MGEIKNSIVTTTKGAKATFFAAYESQQKEINIDQIALNVPSEWDSETYTWFGQAPNMQLWNGEIAPKGLSEFTYTLANKLYESTLGIDIMDFKREKYGQIKGRIQDQGARAADHPLELLATLVEAGNSTLCYDGQYFFDTDHSEGSSGTQDNDLTYNAALTTALTVNEARAVLDAAAIKFLTYKDDRGKPFNSKLTHVMVHPDFANPYMELYNSPLISDGTTTVSNPYAGKIPVIVNRYLSAASSVPAVYCMDLSHGIKPFVHQIEIDLELQQIWLDSDEAKKRNMIYNIAKSSRNMGYALWQYAILTTIT